MEHEYNTEKKSITTGLNDALGHCYSLHEQGHHILNVNLNLEEGIIKIETPDAVEENPETT